MALPLSQWLRGAGLNGSYKRRENRGIGVDAARARPNGEVVADTYACAVSEVVSGGLWDKGLLQTADTVTVILNWRGQAEAIAAAQSCRRTCPECQVLIVDNESTEESFSELTAPFAGDAAVHVLPVVENRGFGAAHNVALQWIRNTLHRARFVYFLNSDAVTSPGAIQTAVQLLRAHPEIGAVGSILLDWDGSQESMLDDAEVQSAGGRFHPWLGTTHQHSAYVAESRIDYVTFAAVALRIDAMFEIGLFDEQFFMYWEDADVCLRLRSSGWGLVMCPDSQVFHVGGTSGRFAGSSRILSYYVWSSLLFRDRAQGPWRLSIPLKSFYMMVRGVVLGRRWEVAGVRAGYRLYRQSSNEPGYVRVGSGEVKRARSKDREPWDG